ncbi:phosphotransferase, partial [Halobium palmae]
MSDVDAALDASALRSYLSGALDAEVVDCEVLGDGLNLVVAVTTTEDGPAYVLRRPNELRRTSLFVDLGAEHDLLRRLRNTEVPAPEPVHLCDDESLLGGPFAVQTRLDGEPFPRGSEL